MQSVCGLWSEESGQIFLWIPGRLAGNEVRAQKQVYLASTAVLKVQGSVAASKLQQQLSKAHRLMLNKIILVKMSRLESQALAYLYSTLYASEM